MKSKPTFRQPAAVPAPAANVDDWVGGGAGGRPPTPAERVPLARLTIDIPVDLHTRFKIACARHRTKMKDEILTFITDWTQKHDKS